MNPHKRLKILAFAFRRCLRQPGTYLAYFLSSGYFDPLADKLPRLYCSKTCQKAHTPKHSCLCPGFRKAREEQPEDACGNCGAKQAKDGSALKRCARCKKRAYCSVECQKEHYPVHASKCRAEAETAREEQESNGRGYAGLNVLQTW